MIYTINDLPKEERPRERLIRYGPQALADYELLAILLRTGMENTSVLEMAKKILIKEDNLGRFNNITIEELKENQGIKDAKAVTILAAIEFGKRICNYQNQKVKINNIRDAYEYLHYDMENLLHEEIKVIYLNMKSEIIQTKTLSIGCANSSNCDSREIVRWALKLSSYNFIIAHNHPAGDPTPSTADITFTKDLKEFSYNMGVKLCDHLIIGKKSYYSFFQKKLFQIK